MVLSADEKTLAVGDEVGVLHFFDPVRLWETGHCNGLPTAPFLVAPHVAGTIHWSKHFIVKRDRDAYRMWDVASGKVTFVALDEGVKALSPDGKLLAVAHDQQIDLLDFESHKLKRSLKICNGKTDVQDVLFWSANGKRLVYRGFKTMTVTVWDIDNEKPLLTLPMNGNGNGELRTEVALSPDGAAVVYASDNGAGCHRVDCQTGKDTPLNVEGLGSAPPLAWSPDGKIMALGHVVWPLDNSWRPHQAWIGPAFLTRVDSLAWSPDGKTLAMGEGDNPYVQLVRIEDGEIRAGLVPIADQRGLAIMADGSYAATPDELGQELLYVVQTDQGQETLTPDEMFRKYHWKNDPSRVRLTGP